MKQYKYPHRLNLVRSLRDLEHAISQDGNIEFLRDLNTGGSSLEFTKQISNYLNAIEKSKQ